MRRAWENCFSPPRTWHGNGASVYTSSVIRERAGSSLPDSFAWSGMDDRILLNDEDVAVLLSVLRTATQPMTTQMLIDVLRGESAPASAVDPEV